MPTLIDLTDIPVVAAAELAFIVEQTMARSKMKLGSQPQSQNEIDTVVTAFWAAHQGTGAQGLALSLRLAAMLQALSQRRFAVLLQNRPDDVWQAAILPAATLRLNPKWGFNAMRFSSAIRAATAMPPRPAKPTLWTAPQHGPNGQPWQPSPTTARRADVGGKRLQIAAL